MKTLQALAYLGLLAATTAAGADSKRHTVVPVLVNVDSHGKVTDVAPATRLPAQVERLLRETLDEIIARPPAYHGRPVASQFVMNLALMVSKEANGTYEARFDYVSMTPVPAGSWYWVNIDHRRLALANRNFERHGRAIYRDTYPMPDFQRMVPARLPAQATGSSRAPPVSGGRH